MHWLAADGQPGWPGETPGALAAELELSEHSILQAKTLLIKRSFGALTYANSSIHNNMYKYYTFKHKQTMINYSTDVVYER